MKSAKHKNIGIIGLGSIGRKHADRLKQLGVQHVYALRTLKGSRKSLESRLSWIKEVSNEETFFDLNLDGVLICNPTSLHVESMNKCLKRNIPIFVEKPVFSDLSQSKELIQGRNELIMVGFCLRFHPIIIKVKDFIRAGKLGKLAYARFVVGQYLPSWHPYTDYRTEYFSRKELGGGALRTLSHEIDLMIHFFGSVQDFETRTYKLSELEIDVDDYALVNANYPTLKVQLSMDFISRSSKRNGFIIGENGQLNYCFTSNRVWFVNNYGETEEVPFDGEELYLSQMDSFLQFIEGKENKGCSFEEAMETMKIIDGENRS